MTSPRPGTLTVGDLELARMGYGAMQLAGPHVMGPPADRDEAVAVLRAAVDAGVNHIDTSDFYGPYVVNEIIREALHPYPEDLHLVTKVGFTRGPEGTWDPAQGPDQLREQVHGNLSRLGLDALDVVNLRLPDGERTPLAERLGVLAELREQGLVRHVGLSNAGRAHLDEARAITPIVCVQNLYNLAHRVDDDLVDHCAAEGIAFVPFFPLGGFTPLQHDALAAVATELDASPQQVALAWSLQRSRSILVIPGTSRRAHLRENLAAADLVLSPGAVARLDAIGGDAIGE